MYNSKRKYSSVLIWWRMNDRKLFSNSWDFWRKANQFCFVIVKWRDEETAIEIEIKPKTEQTKNDVIGRDTLKTGHMCSIDTITCSMPNLFLFPSLSLLARLPFTLYCVRSYLVCIVINSKLFWSSVFDTLRTPKETINTIYILQTCK